MEHNTAQLKRNRAKVFIIGAGLFLLGSQGPDIGDLFDRHDSHRDRARHERITIEADIDTDRIDEAAERVADLAERAALMAERAADAAERASEQR